MKVLFRISRCTLLGSLLYFVFSSGVAEATGSSWLPPERELAPEVQQRLLEVSADPALEAWQSEFR